MDGARQDLLFEKLASLADHLVSGMDIADLADETMRSCLELLDVSAAGILLEDERGMLKVLASSSDEALALELLEVQSREGPCLLAFTTGAEVVIPDLNTMQHDWPTFVQAARAEGIVSAAGLPLMLRGHKIGAVNLFSTAPTGFSRRDLQLARLLASVATVGILNQRVLQDREVLARQLQIALDSRVPIEQAKGIIAARAGVSVGAAFEMLRSAARASQRPITEIARDIVGDRTSAVRLIQRQAKQNGSE